MKNLFVQLGGGIGKQAAFTGLLPVLKRKYNNIYIVSSYPDLFYGNKNVKEVNPNLGDVFYKNIIKSSDTKIVLHDPYDMQEFIQKKIHLLKAYSILCDVEIESGMELIPELFFADENEKYAFEEIYSNIMTFTEEKFILVQFHGGQSPLSFDEGEQFTAGQDALQRPYPVKDYIKLILKIRENYPDHKIIRYALPNEFVPYEIRDVLTTIDPAIMYKHYAFLSEYAEKVVCIDSSLHHLARSRGKQCIVIWGETAPEHFGYDYHINLREKQSEDNQPYFRLMGKNEAKIKFSSVEKVLRAMEE